MPRGARNGSKYFVSGTDHREFDLGIRHAVLTRKSCEIKIRLSFEMLDELNEAFAHDTDHFYFQEFARKVIRLGLDALSKEKPNV